MLEEKIWTPESAGISFEKKGKMSIMKPLENIPQLDTNELSKKKSYIRRNLRENITKNKKIRYSIAGIIGIGKSSFPEIVLLDYVDARVLREETNNLVLQLFYQDMNTYSFPLQFYLSERRENMIREASRSTGSTIDDRSFYEDIIFSRLLKESGAMSFSQLDYIKRVINQKIDDVGHPDVLIWLQGSPETAYKRKNERGIEYEVDGKERPLTERELGKISSIRDSFLDIVKKYAPSELENYKMKHEKAGLPSIMRSSGVTLDYEKALYKSYNEEFEGILEGCFNGTLIKLNVDDSEGVDIREDSRYQVAFANEIMNATLLKLYNEGNVIRMDESRNIKGISLYN